MFTFLFSVVDNPHTRLRASLSPVSPLHLSRPTVSDNSSSTTTTISSTSCILDFSSYNELNSGINFVSLKEVVLKKDNSCSIGISFVAGNIPGTEKIRQGKQTPSLPAIFVKSITPGGPADLNGHVNPNDQILAVNGSTVTGLTCQDIINQIKQSPWSTPIQLLLLQRSHQILNKQSVSTSNEPHTRLQTRPYSTNSTLPTDQSLSSSANDFVTRTLSTSWRHSSGSTLAFFKDHYIPEHHVSVPNILDALQETKATSTRFYPTILSGSLSSLQECKRPKNVSTGRIGCNLMEKQTNLEHFDSLNSVSIPGKNI